MVISDLCMHGPPTTTDSNRRIPHRKVLALKNKIYGDLTFDRYQTRLRVPGEWDKHRVAFLLDRKLKAFGMKDETRNLVSYNFVDIERAGFDQSRPDKGKLLVSF